MRSPKPGVSLVSLMATMRVSRWDWSGTGVGRPSLEMLAVDECPCGCFWNVFQDPSPEVDDLEGSDQVAKESDFIIRLSHRGPFIDVSREKREGIHQLNKMMFVYYILFQSFEKHSLLSN